MTNCERDEEDSLDGDPRTAGATAATLFEEERDVRVSDIVGDLPASVPASPTAPKRRRLGLRLDWYDCGVAALIVASLVAATLCLLK